MNKVDNILLCILESFPESLKCVCVLELFVKIAIQHCTADYLARSAMGTIIFFNGERKRRSMNNFCVAASATRLWLLSVCFQDIKLEYADLPWISARFK